MSFFGTPVIFSPNSGVYSASSSLKDSNPSVHASINFPSIKPSFSITCIMEFKRATSVPGLCWRCIAANLTRSIFLGSATISSAPFFTAFFILRPIIGWVSVVFEPMTKITSCFSISGIEFVIAPEPKTEARPATVELCQYRAQWSILFVPITARMNF